MGAMGKTSNYIIRLGATAGFCMKIARCPAHHFELAETLGLFGRRRMAGSPWRNGPGALDLLPVAGDPGLEVDRCELRRNPVVLRRSERPGQHRLVWGLREILHDPGRGERVLASCAIGDERR